MRTFPTLGLSILTLSLNPLTATAQSEHKAIIDKFIIRQAAKERGEEPDGVRKIVEGDLNHDGVSDVAVLYTIEGQNGSNNYVQYLAVFVRKKSGLAYAARQSVGGKNSRAIEFTAIKDNAMLFDTTAYADRDPACCPTVKGRTKYILVGSRLIEKRQK